MALRSLVTESQLVALERAKEEKEAYGEIETENPGYLGSQDTFYVGTLKGVGRIYQQTFVDIPDGINREDVVKGDCSCLNSLWHNIRLAVNPRQHCVRFRIVGECLLGTDELQRAADAVGDVGEMAE